MGLTEWVATLWLWVVGANGLTGYSDTNPTIFVQYVPHSFFEELVCKPVDDSTCPAVATTVPIGTVYVIFIDEKYTGSRKAFVSSLVLHELVHVAQFEAKLKLETCEDLEKWETEAYSIQNLFLVKTGSPPVINMASSACLDEQLKELVELEVLDD